MHFYASKTVGEGFINMYVGVDLSVRTLRSNLSVRTLYSLNEAPEVDYIILYTSDQFKEGNNIIDN